MLVLDYNQDDPAKCTAKKMVRMGLARSVPMKFHASNDVVVLNPFAEIAVSAEDADSKAILVIDCSWNSAREVFFRKVGGKHRRLPALLAANPTNYSKLGRLSSLEAVAAALYVLGDKSEAERYLSIFKWGETFLTLNRDPLEEYSKSKDALEVERAEKEFFPRVR